MIGKRRVILLTLIVLLYLIVGGLFAVRTPAWQAPDEPAHYNYIVQVAAVGCCPIIEMGDWDQAYLDELKGTRFRPDLLTNLAAVQYEDHQPPLYYILAAPVYNLTGGSLTALRLFSVLIGVIIVLCTYGVGMVIYPARPEIALGAAAFVAFLPQHIAILASVNNDALGWALTSMILLASVIYVKLPGRLQSWQLGILVGLALITKASAYMMAGVVLLAILLRWWSKREERVLLFGELVMYIIPALAIGLVWWSRNFGVYGFPDFLGLRAHDAVVVGQPRTSELISSAGFGGYLSQALNTTFNSFWGQFGWMGVPMPTWMYLGILGFLIAVILGFAVEFGFLRRRADRTPEQRNAGLILLATAILAVLAYLYYNTEFQQFQGRYMFPLLIPLGMVMALGVDAWRRFLFNRWDVARWLVVLIFMGFAVVDIWLLWRVIVPNLTP